MKTFFKILTIATLIFGMISCSSDDNGNGNGSGCSNCFTYRNGGNPKTINISKVTYTLSGNNRMELKFHSNSNENIEVRLEGANNFTTIPEGTFTQSSSPVFFRNIKHTEDDGDSNYVVDGMSRQITIIKDGSNYKINFDFTSGVGLTTGNYTGTVGEVNNNPINPNIEVETRIVNGNGFSYRVFYQEEESAQTRRGIIILAVGTGGNMYDGTLNAQCDALAKKGFVAITTTYRTGLNFFASFREDMQEIIANETATFDIPMNKVVLGGLSEGGNRTYGSVLTADPQWSIDPIVGIKGVILECAGGDYGKGRSILYPVLFMMNKVDATVQTTDAEKFVEGLQDNMNPGVKEKSHCLIIPGSGHCTSSGDYKDFILQHIDSWF